MSRVPVRWVLVAAAAMMACPAAEALELNVMTFNIRYGTAADGPNRWPLRRDLLFDVIRQHRPDIVGLQEVLDFQRRQILAACPGFEAFGVARQAEGSGEQNCILYRTDRFERLDGATFWLSRTPEQPGTKSWNSSHPRICTWVRLAATDGAKAFFVFNTHFDHRSQPARLESARLVFQRIGERKPKAPVILTGDFNAGELSDPVLTLKGRLPGQPPGAYLVDTYRLVHPKEKNVRTSHGFRGGRVGQKIDHIFVLPGIEALDAAIAYDSKDGRYPSDHYPVTARLRIP